MWLVDCSIAEALDLKWLAPSQVQGNGLGFAVVTEIENYYPKGLRFR